VAAKAGVSTATVSRVVNTPHLVSPDTAAKVKAVIEQLGYKPNRFAQGLMTRRSKVLGVALPDIYGEFYSELLRGADAEARRLGYHLLIGTEPMAASTDGNGAPPTNVASGQTASHAQSNHNSAGPINRMGLAFGFVDGLAVMITEPNDALWKQALAMELPVVLLDMERDEPGVDCVVVDNAPGTREATLHLLSKVPGERLYFVGGPKENFDTQRRAAAFIETLKTKVSRVRKDQTVYGSYSVEWGYKWATAAIGELNFKAGPAGVLAGNDEIALGILQAAQDSSIKVPEKLKIVGFDDTRVASLVRPTLSTVRIPLAEVGAAAINALASRVADPGRASKAVHLPTHLVIRQSSQ